MTDSKAYAVAESRADEILEMAESGEYGGICVECGAVAWCGVDPDSRGQECESCGEMAVYGAQELMLYAFC